MGGVGHLLLSQLFEEYGRGLEFALCIKRIDDGGFDGIDDFRCFDFVHLQIELVHSEVNFSIRFRFGLGPLLRFIERCWPVAVEPNQLETCGLKLEHEGH